MLAPRSSACAHATSYRKKSGAPKKADELRGQPIASRCARIVALNVLGSVPMNASARAQSSKSTSGTSCGAKLLGGCHRSKGTSARSCRSSEASMLLVAMNTYAGESERQKRSARSRSARAQGCVHGGRAGCHLTEHDGAVRTLAREWRSSNNRSAAATCAIEGKHISGSTCTP